MAKIPLSSFQILCGCLFFVAQVQVVSADGVKDAERAINMKDSAALDQLLSSGSVDANAKIDGIPLLMVAIKSDVESDALAKIVSILLTHHADPNVGSDGSVNTPLLLAIHLVHAQDALLLIQSHADVNYGFCYNYKPGLIAWIEHSRKGLSYGTVLDYAQQQLLDEKDPEDVDGEDEDAGIRHPTEARLIVDGLVAAHAAGWNAKSMKCDAAKAEHQTAISDPSLKSLRVERLITPVADRSSASSATEKAN